MRIIGMDIHRVAAEVVALQDGQLRRLGRVPMLREALEAFAEKQLSHRAKVEEAEAAYARLTDGWRKRHRATSSPKPA